MLRPFNKTNTAPVKILFETEFACLPGSREAVKVEMVQGKLPLIEVHQGIGRARHRDGGVHADTDSNPPGKLGLAGAEFAGQGDKIPLSHEAPESGPEGDGFRGAA